VRADEIVVGFPIVPTLSRWFKALCLFWIFLTVSAFHRRNNPQLNSLAKSGQFSGAGGAAPFERTCGAFPRRRPSGRSYRMASRISRFRRERCPYGLFGRCPNVTRVGVVQRSGHESGGYSITSNDHLTKLLDHRTPYTCGESSFTSLRCLLVIVTCEEIFVAPRLTEWSRRWAIGNRIVPPDVRISVPMRSVASLHSSNGN
jgi:hypothetical protein